MAEVNEDRETRHGDGVALAPAAIGILGLLEPVEGFHDCRLAFDRAAGLLQPSHPVCRRATAAHGRRNTGETASTTASTTVTPTATEILTIAKIRVRRDNVDLRHRDRGGRDGVRGDHLGHRITGRRGLALDLGVHLLHLLFVLLIERGRVGNDRRVFLYDIGKEENPQNEEDQDDDKDRDDDRGNRRIASLRIETGLGFFAEVCVDTHGMDLIFKKVTSSAPLARANLCSGGSNVRTGIPLGGNPVFFRFQPTSAGSGSL